MIRDFLAFAGRTPEQFRVLLGELTRVMLAGAGPPRISPATAPFR